MAGFHRYLPVAKDLSGRWGDWFGCSAKTLRTTKSASAFADRRLQPARIPKPFETSRWRRCSSERFDFSRLPSMRQTERDGRLDFCPESKYL